MVTVVVVAVVGEVVEAEEEVEVVAEDIGMEKVEVANRQCQRPRAILQKNGKTCNMHRSKKYIDRESALPLPVL